MKIAELFVALGFDIKGDQKLVTVEQTLGKAQGRALALLAGVTALNAAFYAMMYSATAAAVALGKFAVSTDLSSTELQKWQHEAATFNVSGDEVTATLEAINRAQADVKLGQGNIAPFQFFGLSVNQSAFDVMKKFAEVSKGMDPAIARTMASQLGITENMFQFLRQSNLDLERFNKNLVLTGVEQQKLIKLNRVWQDIVFSLGALKNRFAETFAEPLTKVANGLKIVVDLMAEFVDWLGRGSLGATVVRWVLLAIVAALGAAFVALSALVAVLGTLLLAVKALAIGALPLLAALAPLVVTIGLIIGALTILILLIDDFWGAIEGKDSLFDWNDGLLFTIKNVERLAAAMTWMMETTEHVRDTMKSLFFNGIQGTNFKQIWSGEDAARPSRPAGTGANTNQAVTVNVQVDGAKDPVSVGLEAGKSVKQAVIEAYGQFSPAVY